MALIFRNLGTRKQGDMSAYSIFNKGFKKPAGSFDASEILTGQAKPNAPVKENRIFGDEEEQLAKMID